MRAHDSNGSVPPEHNAAAQLPGSDSARAASDEPDLGAAIWQAIAQLDARQRMIFLSVRFQQRSVASTASAMDLSPKEANKLLAQATQEVNAFISGKQGRIPTESQ